MKHLTAPRRGGVQPSPWRPAAVAAEGHTNQSTGLKDASSFEAWDDKSFNESTYDGLKASQSASVSDQHGRVQLGRRKPQQTWSPWSLTAAT